LPERDLMAAKPLAVWQTLTVERLLRSVGANRRSPAGFEIMDWCRLESSPDPEYWIPRKSKVPEKVTLQLILIALVGCWIGCSEAPPAAPPSSGGVPEAVSTPARAEAAAPEMPLPSISLGTDGQHFGPAHSGPDDQQRQRALIEALQPLQVMLGTWKGTTQREFGDFKALDEPQWVWDFQTDRDQPTLVMISAASPYFRSQRLTYLSDIQQYQLSVTDPDGQARTLIGEFSQPVEEFQGDDKRLHRRYKLELIEQEPADPRDVWQVVFNQQENNRYLIELSRQRGTRFVRFDTVANQRQGTSFALDDTDYGDQACVITGGLGTSMVTHNKKTYWVCCSGCRKAFEEDPEKWIAAAAELRQD
jgi:hypothetical protein